MATGPETPKPSLTLLCKIKLSNKVKEYETNLQNLKEKEVLFNSQVIHIENEKQKSQNELNNQRLDLENYKTEIDTSILEPRWVQHRCYQTSNRKRRLFSEILMARVLQKWP